MNSEPSLVAGQALPARLVDHHVGVGAVQPDVRALELPRQVVTMDGVIPEGDCPGLVGQLDAADDTDAVPQVPDRTLASCRPRSALPLTPASPGCGPARLQTDKRVPTLAAIEMVVSHVGLSLQRI